LTLAIVILSVGIGVAPLRAIDSDHFDGIRIILANPHIGDLLRSSLDPLGPMRREATIVSRGRFDSAHGLRSIAVR
jgi:hypothetical protein